MQVQSKIRNAIWVLVALTMWIPRSAAQLQVGDNLKMNMNGSLGFGYGGSFTDPGASSHSLSMVGSGTMTGSYYDPNFLSFTVQPYYDRNQSNSASQSIFNESGVTASTNLFSGSHFPGYVGYGRNFNSSGEFGIPGVSGLTTQGSGQTFSVGWSEFLPGLPSLTASYTSSSDAMSLLGADGDIHSKTRLFSLNSNYRLKNFDLSGYYNRQSLGLDTPAFVGNPSTSSDSSSSTYGFMASHTLPMSGYFSATWSHTAFDNRSETGSNSGNTSTTDAMATINPTTKLNLFGEIRYTDNLAGALRQNLINGGSGSEPIIILGGGKSHSFGTSAFANYALGKGFMLHGRISHQSQYFNGQSHDFTTYGGTLSYNYSKPLFGLLYFAFGLVDTAQETGHSGLAFTGNLGMQKRFGRWETSADFSYAQNVQTLIATYTTNAISYGGYLRRKISDRTYWSGTYRGSKSGVLQDKGSNSLSNMYSSTFGWRRYSFTGNYTKSHGRTFLTPNGFLNPAPLPGSLEEEIILFNGSAYSLGAGAMPLRKMTITFNFTRAHSDMLSSTLNSLNDTDRYYTRLDYNLRKLVLRAGYTRAYQSISASGTPPTTVNTYFFGISRWFNVF
jgi:hypothetical protein